jgi:phosphatidylserine decarboxylase
MVELKDYLNTHSEFKEAFEKSFQIVHDMGIPQFAKYNIKTFANYLEFYADMLTRPPSEDHDGKQIYYYLCIFYFVLDTSPVNNYQSPITPGHEHHTWLSSWLIRYAQELGTFLDTEASLTPNSLKSFYETGQTYHMAEYPAFPGTWKTFNQFFARHINADYRKICEPDNPTVIVSPADSTYSSSEVIDENAIVQFKNVPWEISELLKDTGFEEKFKGGIFMHSYLAPSDYHRQHAPVAGKIRVAKVVPGLCYLQVEVKNGQKGKVELALTKKKAKDTTKAKDMIMPDDPGYQFLQARGIVVIENLDIGFVAACPIGMAQVSSVVLNENILKPNAWVEKGQEISHFQMGGSDFVLLFEQRSQVQITAKQDDHYNVGQQIATATRIHK